MSEAFEKYKDLRTLLTDIQDEHADLIIENVQLKDINKKLKKQNKVFGDALESVLRTTNGGAQHGKALKFAQELLNKVGEV